LFVALVATQSPNAGIQHRVVASGAAARRFSRP
jgi:hypothetical protein